MKAYLVCLMLLCCPLLYSAEKHKFRVQSDDDIQLALKELEAQLAPLLPSALEECGMSSTQALAVAEQFFRDVRMVDSMEGQILYDYKHANDVLAAMPKNIRQKYLILTYAWVGHRALLRKEVAALLHISDAQREKLRAIYIRSYERLAPANRRDFSYEMNTEQKVLYGKTTERIERERDLELLGVLDENQRSAWIRLLGPPSKALEDFRKYCEKQN